MDPTIVQRVRILIMQHRQLQGSGSPMRFQRMEVFQNAAVTLSGLLDDSKIVEYSSSSFHDGHTLFSFSEQYDFNRYAWFRTAHIPDGSYGCLCRKSGIKHIQLPPSMRKVNPPQVSFEDRAVIAVRADSQVGCRCPATEVFHAEKVSRHVVSAVG